MDLGISGKVALVFGGSKGIGLGCAHEFAREGCKTVIAARTQATIDDAVAEVQAAGGQAIGISADCTSKLGIAKAGCERECGAADDQAEACSSAGKGQPDSSHGQGCRREQARLLGESEIGDDAAAEQDRDPEREAVGFGFEGAGNGVQREGQAAQAALRPVRPMFGAALPCLCPDLSPALCYISRASSPLQIPPRVLSPK